MRTYDIINAGPKNRFMANRRIVSNSGRHIQLQNLVRNSIPTLDEARELIKMGCFDMVESIYGSTPEVLSQLIRTILIPKPGHEFIVADFSAIEARVLAWEAGEQWRLDAFERGDDIYCASASAMFGVPVVKHGVNGELRQRGKVAELACIAEDSLVLTDAGLVPIQDVTKEMKLWDGEEWVTHDGVIYRGEREVITYDGLTATPDHLVFIEGQPGPVRFDYAATSSACLLQAGNGWQAIRLGEDYKPGKTVERNMEQVLCADRVPRMRRCSMASFRQSYTRSIERLPKLHTAKTNTQMAGSTPHGGKAAMREPQRQPVSQLRSEGNTFRFPQRYRGGTVFDAGTRAARQGDGNRQNRHKRALCPRKSALCKSQDKRCESTKNGFNEIRSTVLALCVLSCNKKAICWNDQRTNNRGCGRCCAAKTQELEWNTRPARVYDIRNAGRHHRFTVSGCLVHNCGYGGGTGALVSMGALDMGLKESELPNIITQWRGANPNIVKYWRDLENAAIATLKDGKPRKVRLVTFHRRANALWMYLPSGRPLVYVSPRLQTNRFGRDALTFEGIDAANKWSRQETYGGREAENATQAIARDLLTAAMWRMEQAGLEIVAHVHDEVIIEAPTGKYTVDDVCAIMNQNPGWAEGLPLSSAGYKGSYYFKD